MNAPKPTRIQLSPAYSDKARAIAAELEERGEIDRYHTAYVPINRALEWLIDQYDRQSTSQSRED